MKAYLQFQILKAARLLELYSVRARLQNNRIKLLKTLKNPRMAKFSEPYRSLFSWIDRSIADIQQEINIWKKSKNFDQLHENDMIRATEKMDQVLAEVRAYLGDKYVVGEDAEFDGELMKVLKYWEER